MRYFTVWQFRGVTYSEVKIVARNAEIDDLRFQSEYQKVLGQVWANNAQDAVKKVLIVETC